LAAVVRLVVEVVPEDEPEQDGARLRLNEESEGEEAATFRRPRVYYS
jgi:hypothetical protein